MSPTTDLGVATGLLAGVIAAAVALMGLVALRPSLLSARGGKILAFLALFVLPVGAVWGGWSLHTEASKSTQFCMSCHVMEPYGTSLLYDDTDYLPASHFQNRRIELEHACFTCHTQYTMFGDYKAKLQGLRHVWVNYVTGPPPAGEIELYSPYSNRECLHCHAGGRAFAEMHEDDLPALESNDVSCLECHEWVHGIADQPELEPWADAPPVLLRALSGEGAQP